MSVRDDVPRSRLTAFFRLLLAIPHLIWLYVWSIGMVMLAPVHWAITFVKGRPSEPVHDAYVSYLRYSLHVYAYLSLAGERYPGFLGEPGRSEIEVTFAPPHAQSRWSIGFRLLLAFPPFVLSGAIGGGSVSTSAVTYLSTSAGLAVSAALLAWFAVLFTGAMPSGLRDVLVYAWSYSTQVSAYFFLVTRAYPNSDPRVLPLQPRPPHPVRLRNDDDPRRHRLLTAFRLPLMAPHFAWLTLWGVAALLAGIAAWASGIALGRVPRGLHRFLAAYVRYNAHAYAFLYLAGGPYPGFGGRAGTYPIDIDIDAPGRMSRWSIGFRWLLSLPALILAASMSSVLLIGSIGAWFAALATGRVPTGLHALLAYATRYSAMAYAYALLVTGTYPHSGLSEAPPRSFLTTPEHPLA